MKKIIIKRNGLEETILVNPENIVSVEHTGTVFSRGEEEATYTLFLADGREHDLSLKLCKEQFPELLK
jgi:hypothetical protein